MIKAAVTLAFSVSDELQLRKSAYDEALDCTSGEEEASRYLDPEQTTLGQCLEMLIDTPDGARRVHSESETEDGADDAEASD